MAFARLHSLTPFRLRLKSAYSSLPTPLSAMAVAFFVVVSVSVKISDGASVPITSVSSMATTPTVDLDDLKSLTASKILMDHTSSTSSTGLEMSLLPQHRRDKGNEDGEDMRLEKNVTTLGAGDKVKNESNEQDANNHNNTAIHSDPTVASSQMTSFSTSSLINEKTSYEMNSPLHVARCRATCLQKFHQKTGTLKSWRRAAASIPSEEASTLTDEMLLLPILRSRKRRSSGKPKTIANNKDNFSWSCLQDSPDCLNCWKSCEVLEPRESIERFEQNVSSSTSGPPTPQGKVNEATIDGAKLNNETKTVVGKKENKSKQSILACSSMDSKQCNSGCQVACSFYMKLLTDLREDEKTTEQEPQEKIFKRDPVVATKHENVLKIVPGKIIWPKRNSNSDNKEVLSSTELRKKDESKAKSVVYVVIQEYPGRKWRQIAQTTNTNIDIPKELTSAMSNKLRSVRVLVVGPDGLISLYSPEKEGEQVEQETMSDNNGNNSVKGPRTAATTTSAQSRRDSGYTTTLKTTAPQSEEALVAVLDSRSTPNSNDHVETDAAATSLATTSSSDTDGAVVTDSTRETVTPTDNEMGGVGEPFQLRVVSLIHQKSLVIAELKWDEIGGNPIQEYLITWELTGGGLKGHLVTDSTSVTLSLWPDTTYQIQVEEFQQNLDAEGEQPAVESSPTSLKSLPLTVDTSEASFPMERPSALLGAADEEGEEGEDDYENEDVSRQEGSVTGEQDEVPESAHKSITAGGFLNMTLLIGITISALVFVLVILTVAAFTWTRMRAVSYSSEDGSLSPMISPAKSMRNGRGSNGSTTGFYSEDKNGCCHNSGYFSSPTALSEPQPLLAQEDLYWEDHCNHHHHLHHHLQHTPSYPSYSSPSTPSSPVHYPAAFNRDRNMLHYPYEISSQQGPKSSSVSVISCASTSCSAYGDRPPSPSSSYLNYYRGDVGSANMAYSLLGNSPGVTSSSTAGGKLCCPSLPSSIELP